MKAVFDSSLLRDYLMGHADAQKEMARYREGVVSVLSMQELLEAPEAAAQDKEALNAFLNSFAALDMDAGVVREAVRLRSLHPLGVPYALVWASARQHNLLLVATARSAFATINDPSLRIAY